MLRLPINRAVRVWVVGVLAFTSFISSSGKAADLESLPLQDPSYQFDASKLAAADNAFHFLRTFVDYYYLLIAQNQTNLPAIKSLMGTTGWCVGDAHPENFGILIQQSGKPLFTMNDIDDSGPCPVILDLVRLMVSSELSENKIDLSELTKVYMKGLRGKPFDAPAVVTDLLKKSAKLGTGPSDKRVQGRKLIRTTLMQEVSAAEINALSSVLPQLAELTASSRIIDAVSTAKVGGGSGGLLRYEVLVESAGQLLHLELKTQVTPSIYPVATAPIPNTADRIRETLAVDQEDPSVFYKVVRFANRDMLVRPQFAGNVHSPLDRLSGSDARDLISMEAYTLGQIHSRTIANTESFESTIDAAKLTDLSADVELLKRQFEKKFALIKH